MARAADFPVSRQWADPRWRLSNLYRIEDKDGRLVPFRPNWAQLRLMDEMWYQNVVLKARQLGFSTFISLFQLDACLFNSHTSAGLIADTLGNAQTLLRTKVKLPYAHLPEQLQARIRLTRSNETEMLWSNGSSYRAGTSLRSGTYQYLHVSEHGKICARAPDKAREIRTGALNTVQAGNFLFIESTAEGRSGDFKEICDRAQRQALEGREPTRLDIKFHFFAWWQEPGYELPDGEAAKVVITAELERYFDELEAGIGRRLTPGQRAWYAKKLESQGDDMKREFPSTPAEAFEASIEGAYFATQMTKARKDGRICRIPVLDAPVDTYWDLGLNDSMAISFVQRVGKEVRFVDYYENSGEGFGHYADVLAKKGYRYGRHYMPHDADQRSLGKDAKSRRQHAEECGIRPVTVVPRIRSESVGIDASRAFLPQCWFDEARCARLIECLDGYRKAWDERNGVWKDHAVHDAFSHGYKSFETAAVARQADASRSDWSKPIASAYHGAARG